MITKWKLFNFKSVRRETELDLGPLTILAGPNSSGKSTLIQSMLLVSQTLSSKVSSRSVVLNGGFVKLGQFDDLVSFGSSSKQILIGWECELQPRTEVGLIMRSIPAARQSALYSRGIGRLKSVSCEFSFDVDTDGVQRELAQLQPKLFSCRLCCAVTTEDGDSTKPMKSTIDVSRSTTQLEKTQSLGDFESEDDPIRQGLVYDVDLDEESVKEIRRELISAEPLGCIFRHFLPEHLSIRQNEIELEAYLTATTVCDLSFRPYYRSKYLYLFDRQVSIPKGVIELLRARLGDSIEPLLKNISSLSFDEWHERMFRLKSPQKAKLRQDLQEIETDLFDEICDAVAEGREPQYRLIRGSLSSNLSAASVYLDEFYSEGVKYLGPLRDEPKALYPLATTVDPSDIGLRGEYTAAVLDLHREKLIEYLPTANFSTPLIEQQLSRRHLEAAVLDWLKYLDVAEKVETHDRGKLGHELKVMTAGAEKPQDLTHVGVGVSQVLPILVMCLLASKDTTLIIEQPELHLHPKVQTLLGDFFLSVALLGKQCIIETHSEYIINRLRFRAASAKGDVLSAIMKVYFVEKCDGESSFREVAINEYGAIIDWPDGFFDQSQSEAEDILRAATLKRKKERGERKDAQRND